MAISPVIRTGTAPANPQSTAPQSVGTIFAPPPIISSSDVSIPSTSTMTIPLDVPISRPEGVRRSTGPRDSQHRREALQKGKEGSRRRQRWENDRLLHVPNLQPPLPSDWEVHPTYPVHNVPYYLAPLWDAGIRHRAEEAAATKKARASGKVGTSGVAIGVHGEEKGRVPQGLRMRVKKSKGARTLLQGLEEEVRKLVAEWEARGPYGTGELDSEDEEIVFVGRNGRMSDEQCVIAEGELEREKCIYDALVDDAAGGFCRWLVHSIAAYYGLSSRSVTVGNPARREAYVGIKRMDTGHLSKAYSELPRPLWGLI